VGWQNRATICTSLAVVNGSRLSDPDLTGCPGDTPTSIGYHRLGEPILSTSPTAAINRICLFPRVRSRPRYLHHSAGLDLARISLRQHDALLLYRIAAMLRL